MVVQHEQHEGALSSILQNYIEIIFRLEVAHGSAKASSVADEANVSRSTVTSALKSLKSMGYIEYEPYSSINLTPQGKRTGKELHHKHAILQDFMQNILQIKEADASEIACKLEHDIPQELIWRLGQFLLFLKSRPEMWEDWQNTYINEELLKHTHKPTHNATHPSNINEEKKNG